MKPEGFTLIELMIVVAIISILAIIAVPNFVNLRQKAYDASAKSVGYSVKVAEEAYFNDYIRTNPTYTSDLNNLLAVDKNLTDDFGVTFTFIVANSSGFTMTTTHSQGTDSLFTYHD